MLTGIEYMTTENVTEPLTADDVLLGEEGRILAIPTRLADDPRLPALVAELTAVFNARQRINAEGYQATLERIKAGNITQLDKMVIGFRGVQWIERQAEFRPVDSIYHGFYRQTWCDYCNKQMNTNDRRHKFCSNRCRLEHFRKKSREWMKQSRNHQPVLRTCQNCSLPFTARRSDAAYCSNACRQRAHRARNRQ